MSANIYRGGIIGADPVFQSGVFGVGDNGMTYEAFTPEYVQVVLADNPTGFWLLNETSGSTAVDSASSYDLTYNNSPTLNVTGPGVQNLTAAVTFNGTDENAKGDNSATYNSSSSGSWSLETWLKYTSSSTGSLGALVFRNTDGAIGSVTGVISCNVSTAGVISGVAITTGDAILQLNSSSGFNNGLWHHVVLTAASGGSLRLYVNGSEVASSSTARKVNATDRSVTVASGRTGVSTYQQFFPGSICGVAVYLHTLSAAQIERHYEVGKQ